MPKLILDGDEIEVPAGTTILQAALSRGLEIPHYCYHPGLSIAGNCRMCLVEVEKAPKLQIACYTPVQDGMVVNTDNARVRKARAAMMEFFLINHPLDCPICDQAGECRLQEYAVEHGTGVSRYVEPKVLMDKAVDIGPHVLLDQERCIHCSRCIRFCEEVTGTNELAFYRRGDRTVIGVFPGRPLANPYSGNVVDLCPVGALTLKEFRFRTRVWYLKNIPTVCVACSRGCNIVAGVGRQQELFTFRGQLDEKIKRIVPRANADVNGHWICDEGRLSYERLYGGERLRRAEAGSREALAWDEAVRRAAETLREAGAAGRLGIVVSPRLLSEDLFAWRLLAEGLGSARVGVHRLVRGEDDAILIRADKGANSRGVEWVFPDAVSEEALYQDVREGRLDTLLVLGDPLDADDTPEPPGEVTEKLRGLVYVGPFVAGAAKSAQVLLPAAAWSEEEGTVVNFQGRVQRVQRCHLPEGEGRPGWRVAMDLASAAGVELPAWAEAADVLAAVAEAVTQYEGLSWENIGLLGVPAAATAPA